ncbi:MAG: hypothetical protein KC503_21010 [Myxococcales bacterium]|nr:hypothetical protein [Myxococcales bacterium]
MIDPRLIVTVPGGGEVVDVAFDENMTAYVTRHAIAAWQVFTVEGNATPYAEPVCCSSYVELGGGTRGGEYRGIVRPDGGVTVEARATPPPSAETTSSPTLVDEVRP